MPNINMIRISTKIDEIFGGKIDLSDCSPEIRENAFRSRAISALAIMMNSSINETGACKCITDGYHDIGIDAVYRDELQKKLFLVQGKWRNDGNGGVTQEEINSFVEGVKRVINLDFAGVNSKLASAVSDMSLAVKSMEYQIHTIFCHTGNQQMNEYCMRPVNELLRNVNDGINEILIFSDIRQSDIFNYFASGQDANNIDIDDVVLTSWGMVEEPRRAYYGTLPAAALGEWYNTYGNRLFAKNIRYYKGSTEVNSGMRNTLETEPENFFYYNNGIKLLCRRIVRKPAYSTTTKTGVFALEGVSLINGAQTTGTIGTAYKEIPDNVGRAFVMIQLIDLSDATDEYATMITKLSNTQNRIESRDFAALDPEQERIKTDLMFSGITYLYKSGASIEDPEHQVAIDEAIIAMACANSDVSLSVIAKRYIGGLTEDINKPPYKLLFNGSTNAFHLKNCIAVLRIIDDYLQKEESSYQGRDRLALVHGNRIILHLVLQKVTKAEGFSYRMIPYAEISECAKAQCAKIIPSVIEAMNVTYPESYPANIFKNATKCKEIVQRCLQ